MTVTLLIGMTLWLPGLRSRRVAAQSPALMGPYGFTVHSASPPTEIVGVMTFDGAGNLTGSETLVQLDPSPNARTVQSQTIPLSGTYKVNDDGTATMTIQLMGGPAISVSGVITDGGSGVVFVATGGTGNQLLNGTARKQ